MFRGSNYRGLVTKVFERLCFHLLEFLTFGLIKRQIFAASYAIKLIAALISREYNPRPFLEKNCAIALASLFYRFFSVKKRCISG